MLQQAVPAVGRIAEPEADDRFTSQASFLQIVPCLLRMGLGKLGIKKSCRLPVGFVAAPSATGHFVVDGVGRKSGACFFTQKTNRLRVIEVFDHADEGDGIAARAAAEAIRGLCIFIYYKGRSFFIMKGAQANGCTASAAHFRVTRNEVFNVDF